MVKIQCRKDFERMPSTSTADDSSDFQSIVMGSNHDSCSCGINFSFTSPSSYPELCLVEEQLCRISRDLFSRLEANCGMNLLNGAWQALDEALKPLC